MSSTQEKKRPHRKILMQTLAEDEGYCCIHAYCAAHDTVSPGGLAAYLGVGRQTIQRHRQRYRAGLTECLLTAGVPQRYLTVPCTNVGSVSEPKHPGQQVHAFAADSSSLLADLVQKSLARGKARSR